MTTAPSTTTPAAPAAPAAPGRDLVLDAVRAGCLVVVVVWHCALSVLHRDSTGALSMPNPVGAHRGLWLLTWALQVMPLFFVVSGAANGPSWARARIAGTSARAWAGRRAVRFATPLAVLGVACAAAEGLSRLLGAGPFLAQHLVVLVPLWTLGLLLAFAPLTPALDAAERRGWGPAVAVGLVAAVAAGDLVRFRFDVAAGGWVSTAAAWLFAYHLGWAYRRAVAAGSATAAAHGRALFLGGLAGLVLLTNVDFAAGAPSPTPWPYPRAMVATTTDPIGNLFPTTLPIVALACFHLGLLLMVRPRLAAAFARPRGAALVARASAVALPVYLLHMVALVAVVLTVEAAGGTLGAEPDATWWLQRPFWLIAPAAVLVVLVRITRPLLGGADMAVAPPGR